MYKYVGAFIYQVVTEIPYNSNEFSCSMLESLTKRDLIDVLPYGNQADIIELKGVHLLEALEHSVSKYNPKAPGGEFLQVSGNSRQIRPFSLLKGSSVIVVAIDVVVVTMLLLLLQCCCCCYYAVVYYISCSLARNSDCICICSVEEAC